MKTNLLPLLAIILLASCANTDVTTESEEENTETVAKEETVDIDNETVNPKIDFNFELIIPDTAILKKEFFDDENSISLGYAYLTKYYKAVSDKDSVEYYGDGEDYICHFYQEFEYGISYMKSNCSEEGGAQQRIVFPLVDGKLAKEFVNTLFYDSWNTWTTDFKYEADGAGCYYTIIQTDSETIIDIWCGC